MIAGSPLQAQIESRGREIFARMRAETHHGFGLKSISQSLMDWSMRNEALKLQLFHFVDVLPALKSSREIAQHAREYLGNGTAGLPELVRWGIRSSTAFPWFTAFAARKGVAQMARTFILARNGAEAVPALHQLRKWPLAFTADILGETALSEREAAQYQARYLELIESLAREAAKWPKVGQIDTDDHGDLPRVNVSVKISALYSQIRATDPETAIAQLSRRLVPLLMAAKERGVFINFDMESTALKELTFELFKRLCDEPQFKDYPHVGLALQGYLRSSEQDLESLISWARARNRRITVRLIKGAYWDYETILARQRGWPVPVFEHKTDTDAQYERLARRMLESSAYINCAFGTHNVRSIAACMILAEKAGVSPRNYEFQMLHGMGDPIKRALVKMGYRVRDYCPIGEVLPGMSYLVRRLLENTSNEGFLKTTFHDHASEGELLRDPVVAKSMESGIETNASPKRHDDEDKMDKPAFRNEPLTDFTIAANRERMRLAIEQTRTNLGKKYPLFIGGKQSWTDQEILSLNPAKPQQVVGYVAKGTKADADAALDSAQSAFREWSKTNVENRAAVLERAAELMRQQRFELAALEIFETSKNWVESDADVAEAIDFCNYYAQEMRRLAFRKLGVPGESGLQYYAARGVALVIAPWNFPLAILCGMATAALVAGNTVIMKPAEQSSVVASRFMDILREAGIPSGVASFLPGSGAEIGAYLVEHPKVALIAFTGSREVGLKIYEAAGQTKPGQKQLKHVVCEMGGKNAMIIDNDADLDEAIPAALYSAFGFQGQKCSALSRLIILENIYDRALERLLEAARGLQTGLPEDAGTVVGPVIDEAAYKRILQYIEIGKQEGKLAFQGIAPSDEGYFIPPTIFTDVSPQARIAQEEIFGPVLCVMKAANLGEALAWANATDYALTGGIFSRSPANIERVKAEMEVGNLYINRSITGAMVSRHPFGGFKMSGGGTKAGGSDYLLNFLLPRVVTENTMRHGFAPDES